jgi:hypothetical protein
MRVGALVAPDPDRPNDAAVGALFSQTRTDEMGRYRLEDILPGRYYIVTGRVDAPTYYPGVTNIAQAKVIAVDPGSNTTGIDFPIAPVSAQPAPITGLVIRGGQFSPPNRSVSVRLSSERGALLLSSAQGPIRIRADGAPAATNNPGPGTVSALTTNPTLDSAPALTTSSLGAAAAAAQTYYSSSAGQADGTAILPVPDGQYRLIVENLPDNYEVKSMFSGTVDLKVQLLKVTSIPPTETVQVKIGLKSPAPRFSGKTVQGRVLEVNGTPTGAGAVLLSGQRGTLFSDGTFEFLNVPAGPYSLTAHEGSPNNRKAEIDVTVGDTDLTATLIYTTPPTHVKVEGRLVVDGVAPPFNNVRLIFNANAIHPVAVGADGQFSTTLQGGVYYISVSGLSTDFTIRSFSSGAADSGTGALRVDPNLGSIAPKLVVTAARLPRQIVRGRLITAAPASGLANAQVTLIGIPESYTSGVAEDGAFEFLPVVPGHYKLVVQHPELINVPKVITVGDRAVTLQVEVRPTD